MIYLAVAVGGALGALSRFGIGQWLADSGYAHLHPATFLVNVIGALLIGILFVGPSALRYLSRLDWVCPLDF